MSTSVIVESDLHGLAGTRTTAVKEQDEKGWVARAGVEPFFPSEPFDWTANPYADPNWYAIFHSWRMMDAYIRTYWRTKDSSYLRRIVPWIASWGAYYDSQRDDPSEMQTLGGTSGSRGTRLAIVLDAHLNGDLALSSEERAALFARARADAAWLMTPGNMHTMNHGYYQIMGLEQLCRVLKDEPWAASGRDFAAARIAELVPMQFTAEGVHVENSPCYHDYALRHLERSSLSRIFPPETLTVVQRANAVLPWLVFPDGNYADVGDSAGSGPPLRDVGANVRRFEGVDYAVAPFWRSGYGIVRSLPEVGPDEASMLFVVGTAHAHTHSHADKLSFELYEFGQRLIVDSGKYGYVKPMNDMRRYVESAAAHNTVGLATTEIRRLDIPLGRTFLFEPRVERDGLLLAGETTIRNARYVFKHRRELIYRPRESLRIHDFVSSDRVQAFSSCLHFDRSLEDIEMIGPRLVIALKGGRSMVVTMLERDAELRLHRGGLSPVRGWQSVGYLQMEPTTMVEAICSGRTRTIRWSVSFV
ncbi:alginate lyase family protein [Enterovirga rhinocerotis]|uniref:Heparinase II/III-like protein n=1 Tax=Enterovirga rhinocerotis TaxID=1339210 RepID=A0A4R7C1W2_9HYPH|nr:alginate lyase family protein [Enterovirga rhinocerotis]TDR90396.1 heparinase II/III-like protein [Enterovirga rhinocerotis]